MDSSETLRRLLVHTIEPWHLILDQNLTKLHDYDKDNENPYYNAMCEVLTDMEDTAWYLDGKPDPKFK
jgi:hypothetical protein